VLQPLWIVAGSFCAPAHDIVAVVRWIERRAFDEFVKRLLAAVGPAGK